MLVNTSEILNYHRFDNEKKLKLKQELIYNYRQNQKNEILGYKIINNKNVEIISTGKSSELNVVIDLCDLYGKLSLEKINCPLNIYVFINEIIFLNKLKEIDSSIKKCFSCEAHEMQKGVRINGLNLNENYDISKRYFLINNHLLKILCFIVALILLILMFILLAINVINKIIKYYVFSLCKALQRIQDIVNNLILKQHDWHNYYKKNEFFEEPLSVEFISNLVDSLISKKRAQYKKYCNLEIELKLGLKSYGIFSKIQPREFDLIFSNLIDNAVNSLNGHGKIFLILNAKKNKSVISINYNGRKIPKKIIEKIKDSKAIYRNESSLVKNFLHAKKHLELWGGNLEVFSESTKGNEAILSFPKAIEPPWFVVKLKLFMNSTVIIIDEDDVIHNIWNDRLQDYLKPNYNIKILHFSNPLRVLEWFKNETDLDTENLLFLCDYEFADFNMNGLDVILNLKLKKNSFLVTNRYEDIELLDKCQSLFIRIIPKNFVYYVPLEILPPKEKPFAILIDDELFIHSLWKASANDKDIRYYYCVDLFMYDADNFDKNTPIYIDSQLRNGLRGEEISKEIYEMGFKEIYLSTSYNSSFFPPMSWIKGIRGKEPPWID
ncbi:ATP-binding protein [Fluviispira vulneris]|uniref:ATP-binding protein n=1 Tax=Fluviispira vulneris TaxID=2763012 RepID=UPI0016463010|nr:ATP-binding protein [Fluviispira vulneris]